VADPGDTITISPAGAITANAAGTLTFGGLLDCNPATFTGTLRPGPWLQSGDVEQIGSLNTARASGCGTGNSWRFPRPDTVTISASLTNLVRDARGVVSSIELTFNGFQLVWSEFGLASSLYAGDPMGRYTPASDTLLVQMQGLRLISGGVLCPNPGYLDGTMTISPRQAITIA
jgi:hypothetical protein